MRKMSATIEIENEGPLPSDVHIAEDAESELGDGSSSLSDIEDKDAEQDDLDDDDDLSENEEDSDANDSEAETERLENSPHTQRNVVLGSQVEGRIYERSPSKLQHQFNDDEEDEEDEEEEEEEEDENDLDNLSDDEGSIAESTKSVGVEGVEQEPTTATTSLEDSSGEGKEPKPGLDAASKKRKRSLLPEGGLSSVLEDLDEPARKRKGSIAADGDDYAIDDTASPTADAETSNPISGDISDAESEDLQDDEDDDNRDDAPEEAAEDEVEEELPAVEELRPKTIGKKGWKKRGGSNGHKFGAKGGVASILAAHDDVEGEDNEEALEVDDDEAEMALKNEEEQEKKRIALEQLSDIEHRFTSFRDRLYDSRLAELEQEEAMLRQDSPMHPLYLEMMKCIDDRRDEKVRIQERKHELQLESLKRSAIGTRSQILSQYYQEVRDIREKKLEELGKQWYDIQHDRRAHGAKVDDYVLAFPGRKADRLANQVAYNTEVSITSGIAKYVGFPSAPRMAAATAAQMDEDYERINASKLKNQRMQPDLALQNMASIRAAATSSFKPAEDQFIEQTPWANPQHPSHAHIIQRQASAHQAQAGRTSSPFSMPTVIPPRRHSHQHAPGPVPGLFASNASTAQPHTNGSHVHGGRISPLNPFTNHLQKAPGPSPLGSRQASPSPQQSRAVPVNHSQQETPRDFSMGPSNGPSKSAFLESRASSGLDTNSNSFMQDPFAGKREQASATTGHGGF